MKNLNQVLLLGLVVGLTACNSGGGGASGESGGGGGGGNLNITPIATISSIMGTTYAPTCMYSITTKAYLVNADGSGTGYSLNTTSGQVTQVSGLSSVNASAGDICLPNFGQLVWVNSNNSQIVNVYDPVDNQTQAINLSQSGISGSAISGASFDYAPRINQLFANNNFLNNGQQGFSSFNLSESPITTVTQLDNSLYSTAGSPALYGFWGLGMGWSQMFVATESLPAMFVNVTIVGHGNPPQQNVQTITDSSSNIIPAMATAWDSVMANDRVIVVTGGVQPVLYSCYFHDIHQWMCDKTYTSSILTTKYRIMRLLGANASTLYFMGIDLTKGNIDIFSMNL